MHEIGNLRAHRKARSDMSLHVNSFTLERKENKIMRNFDQSLEYAELMMENKPFWLLSPGLRPTGDVITCSMWDHRVRKIVSRQFSAAGDPLSPNSDVSSDTDFGAGDCTTFAAFNGLKNTSENSKLVARVFFSLFALVFKDTLFGSKNNSTIKFN